MIVRVYTVYDSKAEAYTTPQFYQTKGIAIRAFIEAIKQEDTPFCKYPEDFTLFEVGEFDDSNCAFNLYPTPVSIGKAIEFKSVVNS